MKVHAHQKIEMINAVILVQEDTCMEVQIISRSSIKLHLIAYSVNHASTSHMNSELLCPDCLGTRMAEDFQRHSHEDLPQIQYKLW